MLEKEDEKKKEGKGRERKRGEMAPPAGAWEAPTESGASVGVLKVHLFSFPMRLKVHFFFHVHFPPLHVNRLSAVLEFRDNFHWISPKN